MAAATRLYPLHLAPIFKEKIWGGRLMERMLNKQLPPGRPIGESWELSLYREDITRVLNGPLAGMPLDELYRSRPAELLGTAAEPGAVFPLLTKFIDADRLLSLQVHPPDAYALEHDRELGKTECWYIVWARPGAKLIRGLEPGTTPEAFRRALETGRGVEALVHEYEVKTGDFIFLPTGVVHAIGAGMIVLEIEQNSDMTYRLWDWDRTDPAGRPRPLHLDKGLAVTDFAARYDDLTGGIAYAEDSNRITHLASCRYFTAELLELERACGLDTAGRSCIVLTVVGGAAEVVGEGGERVRARQGDTLLLPAEPRHYTVLPERGATVVKAYIDPTHERFSAPLVRRGVPLERIEQQIFRNC